MLQICLDLYHLADIYTNWKLPILLSNNTDKQYASIENAISKIKVPQLLCCHVCTELIFKLWNKSTMSTNHTSHTVHFTHRLPGTHIPVMCNTSHVIIVSELFLSIAHHTCQPNKRMTFAYFRTENCTF